jgi:methanogenic corrinoid protein MtbC1
VIEAPLEIELSDTVNPLAMIYQRRLMEAFLARDIPQAEQILGEGLASMSPEGLMLDVISPTIGHIGHAWENDKISVAVEHLATNFLRHRLMMWMLSSPPPMSVAPIVLSCAPGEWHEMGLLIMGALLRRRQWPIAYLGQSMPLPDLAKFIQDIKPSLVILVAMTEETARAMQDWPQHLPLAAKTGKPTITYGGRVFVEHPEMRLQVPGLYLGDNLREGLMTIESLLKGV